MTFLEQRLELGLNYGATYGPRFNTAIATSANGIEQRRAIWSNPLITVQLGDRRVNQSELDYLLAFHASTKGAFAGFRIRDWSDYKSGLTAIGTGNGSLQTWQLVKRYTVDTVTVTRAIAKPIDGTLKVYLDGDEVLTGWTCDYTTGVLSTELTGAIIVSFDYDVPVRFEEDKIDFTYEAGKGGRKLFTLAPLTCVELRLEPTIYPTLDVLPSEINEVFDLGYDFGTLGGPSFNTAIATNAAEFESRKSYWANAKGSWDIGDRALIRSELDYFIALFRCARGMAVPFFYKDWQDEATKLVRFAEDRISFRFDAYRSSDEVVIFNLGGVAIEEIVLPPNPYLISLSLPQLLTTPPRQTATASIAVSDIVGNIIPVSSFFLDDIAFIVKADYNILSGYSFDGTRTITIPPDSFLFYYDESDPLYGLISAGGDFNTDYVFNSQTYTFVPDPNVEVEFTLPIVQGILSLGVDLMPSNAISLSALQSKGYVTNGVLNFKIMLIGHGGSEVTLTIDSEA